MELTTIKRRAIKAIRSAREKRYKLREISEATGVSVSALSNIESENYPFSETIAIKVLDGCKALRRKP